MVGFAGRRLDQARHLADDRPFGQTLGRLPDDAQRLAELLDPDQVTVVGVAGEADRHVEFHLVVGGVRLVLPHVARNTGAAQRRAAQTERHRLGPEMMPMPFVRSSQMRLCVSSSSYSSIFEDMMSQNWRTFLSQPGGRSSGSPPIRIEL